MSRYLVLALVCVLSLAAVSNACPLVAAPVAQAQVFASPVAVAAAYPFAQPVLAAPVAFATPLFTSNVLAVNGVCTTGCAVGAVNSRQVIRSRSAIVQPRSRVRSLSIQRQVIR